MKTNESSIKAEGKKTKNESTEVDFKILFLKKYDLCIWDLLWAMVVYSVTCIVFNKMLVDQ